MIFTYVWAIGFYIIVKVSDAILGKSGLTQFRKNFEQVEEANWYYESSADEKIFESSVEHIGQQMRE